MYNILKFIADMGEVFIIVTPITFIIGLIKSIQKENNKLFIIMTIISLYLIILPLFF